MEENYNYLNIVPECTAVLQHTHYFTLLIIWVKYS